MANDGVRGNVGKRLKAAAYRVAGLSQVAAAARAGVGVASIQRWEKTPGDAVYWQFWEEAKTELTRTTWPEAFLTMRQGLRSERDGDRIRAAEILLKLIDGEPTQRHELTGKDGTPIETRDVTLGEIMAERRRMMLEGDDDEE